MKRKKPKTPIQIHTIEIFFSFTLHVCMCVHERWSEEIGVGSYATWVPESNSVIGSAANTYPH